MRHALAFGAFLAMTAPAPAQNWMIGIGNMSCAEVTAGIRNPENRQRVIEWVTGYISGVNSGLTVTHKKVFEVTELNADLIAGTIQSYCSQNPTHHMHQAAGSLVSKLPLRPWTPPKS
ncbi:HdeA/HdeB family chaperone [Bosea sp. (in: a-proteobacteria)]|uniref:HdeA/HdeB family chaperone n=1 Tax=Bosea sp. (in: a-proteobacteria) TaxID=1871050 RepID=UPI0034215BCB